MRFDVVSFLKDHGITYKTSGKNLSTGEWVGLAVCPYCNRADHIAINLNSAAFNCWVCGKHGYAADALKLILGVRTQEIKDLMRPYFILPDSGVRREKRVKVEPGRTLEFPSHFYTSWSDAYTAYLLRRGLDISTAQRFQLMAGGIWDQEWMHRLIIPITLDGQLVSWTGRTILPNIDPRYKNLSNEKSLIDVRTTIFNIDNMERKAILVEGAMDTFKIVQSCGAVIGLEFTNEQCLKIKQHGVEELFVVFDAEENAVKRALRFASVMNTIGVNTHVIDIRGTGFKDPGEFDEQTAAELRRECLGIGFE